MDIRIFGNEGQGIAPGKAIVVVFVAGLLFVCVFVEFVTCPQCGGSGLCEEICPECHGSGVVEGQVTCSECFGRGYVDHWDGPNYTAVVCPKCNGSGNVKGQVTCVACYGLEEVFKPCERCNPEGKVTVLGYIIYWISGDWISGGA